MSIWMKLRNFIMVVVLLLLVMYCIETSRASGNCNGPGDDNCYNEIVDVSLTGGDVIGGDTSVITGNNKSYVLAPPGLGDVAIARCLGSEAWTLLIGGKQKLVLNQVCMADFYLKVGRFDLAAQALCNQPEILKEYQTEVACEADHDFTPAIVEVGFDLGDRSAQFDEHYELAQQQEHEIEYLKEEQASLVGRIDYLTERIEQAPAAVVQQSPAQAYWTDERRAKLEAIKGEQ